MFLSKFIARIIRSYKMSHPTEVRHLRYDLFFLEGGGGDNYVIPINGATFCLSP